MKILRLLPLILFFLSGVTGSTLQAQQFDFEKYPRLNFSFSELDLELSVNPEDRSLKGTAAYELKANIGGVDTLVLQAAHMEIASVSINDTNSDFTLNNDSLIISLPDSTLPGKEYSLSINYSTIPRFGILSNDLGTIWTSMLPQSHRHWLPVVDHPRVTFRSSIQLTVPSGYRAMANGVLLDEEILGVEQVRYVYKTRNAIPVTSLAFAVGQFDRSETSFGVKKITLHTEQGVLGSSQKAELLSEASRILEQIEEEVGSEYPFERLNIAALRDHFWETKSWGASTVFIYSNSGDFNHQLRRGIYAQWFGVYQREERWADADGINLLQSGLHYRMQESPAMLDVGDIPADSLSSLYSNFGPQTWNTFQKHYKNFDELLKTSVAEGMKEILNWGGGVFSFRDYGEFWYEKNGQPIFELAFGSNTKGVETESDSVVYRVDYVENAGNLKLIFEARRGMIDELVTLPLVQISPGSVDTLEVTFTGARDSVSIGVPALIENVKVLTEGRPTLHLDEFKPASYLIYQLRNSDSLAEREEAARKLGYHSDNPDLQLAIKDFMNRELDPRVRAALLTALGQITDGASGTEQLFMDALNSGDKAIQQAGLSVLQNYPGNDAIQQAVRGYASGADSLPVFRKATRVLSSVADSTVFEDFVNEMVRTDTAGHKAIFAIQELANTGDIDKAVRQAEFYISDVYEYRVRSMALNILLQHDHTPADWETRARELMDDFDPRIRFLTVQGLPRITGLEYRDMLNTLIQDEYDERVYGMMVGVLSRES